MSTVRDDKTVTSLSSNEVVPSQKDVVRHEIPAPGRSMSFEEALKFTMKYYPNALRELAK